MPCSNDMGSTQWSSSSPPPDTSRLRHFIGFAWNKLKRAGNAWVARATADPTANPFTVTYVHSYSGLCENAIRALRSHPRYERVYPCVAPSWDNSARRRDGARVLQNTDPGAYARWLRAALDVASRRPPEHRIVFINAWNEWAEGCHLEPDQRVGRGFLEATRDAVRQVLQHESPARSTALAGQPHPSI